MRPTRWFVRVWTVDPTEEGPDDERDTDCTSERAARALAKKLRGESKNAAAFERRNIHVPEDVPIADPPAHFWEWNSIQIDEAAIEREWGKGARVR